MAEVLLWLGVLLVIVLFGLFAWSRYRQHQRRAQARSLAALNTLLAEADEIAQQAKQARDGAPDADDGPASDSAGPERETPPPAT